MFAGLRAATNVLQRDLNTAVIAEEMRKGTKSIYADYVDYDEIAHHAGMFRPESLAALDGLDRVLATLERLAVHAPRRYHIVVLSDHGQSQGQTFRDRFGADLGEPVHRADESGSEALAAPVETLGSRGEPGHRPLGQRTHRSSRWSCRHGQQPTRQPGRRGPKPTSRCWARGILACSTCTPPPGSRWKTCSSAGRTSFPACAPTTASASSPVWTPQVCRGPSVRAAATVSTPAR